MAETTTSELKNDQQASTENSDAFLGQMRERFKKAQEGIAETHAKMLADLQFISGENGCQWLPENYRARSSGPVPRPCLQIDLTHKFVVQISNKIRQMKPGMEVIPVDSLADPDTAEVLQGIMRHIEQNSDGALARGVAADYAVRCGLGYYELSTEYADEVSFDQEIVLLPVLNPFSIYPYPTGQRLDSKDWRYAFSVEKMARSEFIEEFGEENLPPQEGFASEIVPEPDWADSENVRVVKYWYTETEKKTLRTLLDGSTAYEDEIPEESKAKLLPEPRRELFIKKIKWALCTYAAVLEHGDWAGGWIPIIPVYGEVTFVGGHRIIAGVFHNAKDTQRMVNYYTSREAESVALTPLPSYVAAKGQIQGQEKEWQDAYVQPRSVRTYEAIDTSGLHPVPPPKLEVYDPPIQALLAARAVHAETLKHIIGLFDPSFGNVSGERSGRAIRALQEQGDIATFHFVDNLARAMRWEGRQEVGDGSHKGLIPIIYDRPGRVMKILGEDGKQRAIQLGAPGEMEVPEGISGIYDLGLGLYDVVMNMGPLQATQRQEAADTLAQLVQADPSLSVVAGDMIVENLDFPGMRKLSRRLAKRVPPEMRDEEEQPAVPLEVQQQLEQLQQTVGQLNQTVEEQAEALKNREEELASRENIAQLQAQNKLQIEAMRAEVQTMRTEAQLRSKEEIAAYKEETALLRQRIEALSGEMGNQQ